MRTLRSSLVGIAVLALAGHREEDQTTRALLTEALQHPDHAEGTAAFLERRAPRFGG